MRALEAKKKEIMPILDEMPGLHFNIINKQD